MYKYLSENHLNTKIISNNFSSIKHLYGSKMIDSYDIALNKMEESKFTSCLQYPNDKNIVTEKIDGMNAGVIKIKDRLYPINRRGYDTRTMGNKFPKLKQLGNEWANWVDQHYLLLNGLLNNGERFVFENCIMQHTLRYKFKKGPVFLLAKMNDKNERIPFDDLCEIAIKNNLEQPPLLNYGCAIKPQNVINQFPKGKIGSRDGIEGIVYLYEHESEDKYNISISKYVSNELLIEPNPEVKKYNFWNRDYYEHL